mmetsp:Transcript_9082/g.27189  ORF Transcript_9082/g.27189 Transcript_9082/m.27189 type:complete len:789 (-) Transcript_9082:53-2419(-)
MHRFRLAEGCRCLRHQPQHLLFTADGRLIAFEVLDPTLVANQHRNDLYVRWATPTPAGEEPARLAALEAYLRSYTVARRLQTCGRPTRQQRAAKPEYGFLLFGNTVARDAVLGLGSVRLDGSIVQLRPRTVALDRSQRLRAKTQQPRLLAPSPELSLPPAPKKSLSPKPWAVRLAHTVGEPPSPSPLPGSTRGFFAGASRCEAFDNDAAPTDTPGSATLELTAVPLVGAAGLSGFEPSGAEFRAWFEAEMCGLHALHLDPRRKTAVLCFPTHLAREAAERVRRHRVALPGCGSDAALNLRMRACPGRQPTAVAEWTGQDMEPKALAHALLRHFAALLRPMRVDVRVEGSDLAGVIEFETAEARDAVVTLEPIAGPRDAAGRGDTWTPRQPRGEHLLSDATELAQRARLERAEAAACARLRLGVAIAGPAGLERLLPFLSHELCAVDELAAVDARTARVTLRLAAGARCVRHQAQHLFFSADGRLVAFEVLSGARLRAARLVDAGDPARAARDVYARWASPVMGADDSHLSALREYIEGYTTAARPRARVLPGAGKPEQAFLAFASAVARDAVLALGVLDVDGHRVEIRPVAAPPSRAPPRSVSATRKRTAAAHQFPAPPRQLPYSYVIAEPDSPRPAAEPHAGFLETWHRRDRASSDLSELSVWSRASMDPDARPMARPDAPLPAPLIITTGGDARAKDESTVLRQLASFGDMLREERRRQDEERGEDLAGMAKQLDGLRRQVRAAEPPAFDVARVTAALKTVLRTGAAAAHDGSIVAIDGKAYLPTA